MELHYLGTAAAEGVPAVFCNCEYCKTARKRGGRELRSRSQVLIDGVLSVDFPPDAYFHAVRDGVDLSAIRYLIVTHSHMDHFYAHDFVLHGYKYCENPTSPVLQIYGNEEVKKVYAECTRRELRAEVADTVLFFEASPYRTFRIGEYAVTPLPARHTEREIALLYLIEKGEKRVLYLNDTGPLYEEVYEYLQAQGKYVNLVSLDCTLIDEVRSVPGRHMGIRDNMEVKRRLLAMGAADGDTKFVVTHFSHNQNPLSEHLSAIERDYGVIAAYDGMKIEV